MTAMGELREAKEQLRTALLRGVRGTLAGERADELIDRHQHALKAAYREKLSRPARGDQVEQWLKAKRDRTPARTLAYDLLEDLLDEYRLHADTGTPLDQHACENGNRDDCYGCYEAATKEQQ
ncbi:hypothetical protein ACIRVF_08085 [Kitasatospora sp. NPDC101157]|uniref:hypothetical protein n=1 Tax=Kitasatospora sp. NPDC101157 TaxID=3364098 RepID=UPI0038205F87